MDNITILTGVELVEFMNQFRDVGTIHTVRINQREDGFTFKINSGTWSPTIGRRADAGGY